MDGLARKYEYGFEAVCENCPKHGMCNDSSDCKSVLAEKLFAYEDTGLEPHEITPRLRELAQADRDGRVVMLPAKLNEEVWIGRTISELHRCFFATKSAMMDAEERGYIIRYTRAEAEAALEKEAGNG